MERLGIKSKSALERWIGDYRTSGPAALAPKPKGRRPKPAYATREEELEAKIRKLELENEQCLGRRDRAEAASSLRHEWPLKLVEKLDLRRSTYYYLASHPERDAYADVRPLVREVLSRTPNGMGYRQVAMALRTKQGLRISSKTVLRLMREEGCACRIRRARHSSYEDEVGKVAGNVLNREFKSEGPTERLATDVAEFAVAGGKANLSPTMDCM